MANTNHLLDEIDVAVAALKVQKWTATLPFSGFLCKPTDDVLMVSFQDRHDLFSLTQTIYKGFIVRFDPQTFPVVPGGVAKNKDSIKKLFDALMLLDPSELNEDELNIRNKLVTARWKSPQTPTAPASMKSMDEGRYPVGSKSEDKFMSMTGEDLFLYFQALIMNKLHDLSIVITILTTGLRALF
ncbi:hypothetical protein IV203_020194 [Nitzschia inconspicua]|uniref:Uncharacterized protein n=1 Tax=Nitzschia inconspicua TaxID=303405 RepID=A0A9K3Q835_9STRA|nr:hypothetical protein IV203_020194 [Nitzschia inconspicua]